MKNHIYLAHNILTSVYCDGKQLDEALEGRWMTDMATRLVRGVLEQDIKIEFILSQLLHKKPQQKAYILLKIGTYALLDLTDVPAFAIVSECVEVSRMIGKSALSGFVNATLKRVSNHDFALPSPDEDNYLSVMFGKPQWFVDKCLAEFGQDDGMKVIGAVGDYREHIRLNSRVTDDPAFQARMTADGSQFEKTNYGYLVSLDDVRPLFFDGTVTIQSPSSVKAVQCLCIDDGDSVLDVCAAPGGKAVYASELTPHGNVTACDLSSRRASQIAAYSERMHADNILILQSDATKFRADFKGKFDRVLVDAPCSCFGTFLKHPDVFLRRDYSGISELNKLQRDILLTSSEYVKMGGRLVYCVCTIFKEECEDIISCMPDAFTLEHEEKILPGSAYDGFYIAVFKKQ